MAMQREQATATTPLPDVLTAEEAREYLRIGRTAFYDALAEGKLPGIKVGRLWRFRRETLEAWMTTQERSTQWRIA